MRHRFFHLIARIVCRSPWAVLCLAFLLTVASVYLATTRLPLHTDQDDLVSEKLDYHRRYKEFLREFGDQEYLYLVVEAGNDIARAKDFVRHFVGEVGRRGGAAHFREILYRIDNPAMEQSYLLYLPRDQLTRLEGFFRQPGTEPARLARWNDFADLVAGINELLKRPVDPTQRESLTIGFTLLDGIVDGMAGALKGPVIPTPQLQGALIGGGRAIDPDGFFLSENGRYLFALLMPIKNYATLGVIAKPLSLLRDALTATRAALPDVAAGLTGRPVLQADEMVVTNRDMTRGTLLALAAVALLFIGYFRRPTRPVLAVVALVMGMSWTYGFAALSIGYLNILSIVFAVILVGAGIEYGLQLVARYREELAADGDVHRAITSCITQTGRGNLTACLTTAAAFFAALGTQFLALRELGAIAGIGILLCLMAELTVLPAAMLIRDRRRSRENLHTTLAIRLDFLEWVHCRPRSVLTALAIITVLALPGLARLKFDHNLLDLQARGLESVTYELKLMTETDQSTWFTPFIAESAGAAVSLAERVSQMSTVKRVETIADVVPPDQPEKRAILARLITSFAHMPAPVETQTIDISALTEALFEFSDHCSRLQGEAFRSGEADAVAALETLTAKIDRFGRELAKGDPDATQRLLGYQAAFFAQWHKSLKLVADGLRATPITEADLPDALRRRYVSPLGRYVVYAYPTANLWEPSAMAAYIRDIRSIDPLVTGVPVEVYESSRLLERSFYRVAGLALLAICLLALGDFRNWRHAMLAVTPLLAGMLWLLEAMGWMGLPFNMANFFAVPILIGVGVDNGIQLIHRWRQEGFQPTVITRSTGAAVLLTSATTLASFAMLCTAAHRGIFSLGLLMSIGTVTCLVGSLILLPCLLRTSATR